MTGDKHEVNRVNDQIVIDVMRLIIGRCCRIAVGIRIRLGSAPAGGNLRKVGHIHHAVVVHVPRQAAALEEAGHRRARLAGGGEPVAALDQCHRQVDHGHPHTGAIGGGGRLSPRH